MASLKDLRNRISSVKSTRKITSAMKMVAAAKLRRAQDQAEAARPYARRMERMLGALAENVQGKPGAPKLLAGTGKDDVHLLVVATADRGLCGGFNGNILREARRLIGRLQAEGKEVKVFTIGRKARDILRRTHNDIIVDSAVELGRKGLVYGEAAEVSERIAEMFEAGEFDVCTFVYAEFRSAIRQDVTAQQLIPFALPEKGEADEAAAGSENGEGTRAVYEFEPDEATILGELLPRNLAVQIFRGLLENAAGEQGARMTAMDNATRNASDMIDRLTLTYNRTRQAVITSELIEIVSAKEAM